MAPQEAPNGPATPTPPTGTPSRSPPNQPTHTLVALHTKRHRTIDANYNHCDPNETLTSPPTHRTKAYYYYTIM